jgi:ParB family chromosome partitioning protein
MSKKRVFDIDFPDTPDLTVPAGTAEAKGDKTDGRRGPMASAISENAGALRQRNEAENAIRAENDRLAHELVRLKKQGLIVDLIPLSEIKTTKLARDRSAQRDPDLEELKASIRDVGLSNPIRVEQSDGGYELIQGFRRLSAYRELYAETKDEAFAQIPSGLVARGERLEGLYRRMVDENLVRRDISFAEMAELARAYAADAGTDCETSDQAVAKLYASASRQKRSYIRHFATLMGEIGSSLKFAEALPRALGLQLERKISSEEGTAARLRARLAARMPTTVEAELEALRAFLEAKPSRPKPTNTGAASKVKTTFRMTVPAGTVRCSAQNGRIELRAERDFSSEDRLKLEAALAAFFATLDD